MEISLAIPPLFQKNFTGFHLSENSSKISIKYRNVFLGFFFRNFSKIISMGVSWNNSRSISEIFQKISPRIFGISPRISWKNFTNNFHSTFTKDTSKKNQKFIQEFLQIFFQEILQGFSPRITSRLSTRIHSVVQLGSWVSCNWAPTFQKGVTDFWNKTFFLSCELCFVGCQAILRHYQRERSNFWK